MISVYVLSKSTILNKMIFTFCFSVKKPAEDNESDDFEIKETFILSGKCKKALIENKPDVLLLSIELDKWKKICQDIKAIKVLEKLKILVIVPSYKEYIQERDSIHALTNGFISIDSWNNVIFDAINVVHKGQFFFHDTSDIKSRKEEIPAPKWLDSLNNTILTESIKHTQNERYYVDMVKNLTKIIETTEKTRNAVIKILLTEKREQLQENSNDEYDFETILVNNMILNGYSNWKIANRLNKFENLDHPEYLNKIRIKRLNLILRITDKNTMVYRKSQKDKVVKLDCEDIELLRLIAAGYSNNEIGYHLCLSEAAIKSNRKELIDKFLETGRDEENNSMSVVIKALQMGLIKLGEIVELITADSRVKYRKDKKEREERENAETEQKT